MKDNIHPQYGYVVFRDRSAGKAFLTRSTLVAKAASLPTIEWEDGNTYSLVNVEVSSYSPPVLHRPQRRARHGRPSAEIQQALRTELTGPANAGIPMCEPPPPATRKPPLTGAGSRSETEGGRPTGAAHTSTLHKPIENTKRSNDMKVKSSIRSLARKDGSYVVRRRGHLYVINKKNPHWKARQG